MRTELPGEIREALNHLEHRMVHLEDALAQALQLLHTQGTLDAHDHIEYQAGLSHRREQFQRIMRELSREESEWSQLNEYNAYEDCDTEHTAS
jgi:chromosome segregation ATPase